MKKRDFSNSRNEFKKNNKKKNKKGERNKTNVENYPEFENVKIKGRKRGKQKSHKMRDYNE